MPKSGIRGILQPVAYWRKWDPVDRDLGGGFQGIAVLECGHVESVRANRQTWYRKRDTSRRSDELGRPAHCFCIACKIARDYD
jgi:hypothetical protein